MTLKNEIASCSRQLHALLDRGERLLKRVNGIRDAGAVGIRYTETVTSLQIRQIKTIVAAVSRETDVSERQIFSRLRPQPIAVARQLCMTLARTRLTLSTPQIGVIFRREPSGVTYAVSAINDRIATDSKFAAQFARINAEIETKLKSL